jgi:hypothetical protein
MLISGKVIKQHRVYRQDLKNNPDVMYLFGDNMARKGFGGQAAEMRGEPNAKGIATKVTPGMEEYAFFSDEHFLAFTSVIETDLAPVFKHVTEGGIVVIPSDGLGTGLSELPTRAPKCFKFLERMLEQLSTKE